MKNEHDLTEMTRKAYPDGFPECAAIKIIKHDRFRSAGRGVNRDDDMVRVTMEMTATEFKRFQRDIMPKVGDRIRFVRDLTEAADEDHPDIIYARAGSFGIITKVGGCKEGYWVKWERWQQAEFGAEFGKDFVKI